MVLPFVDSGDFTQIDKVNKYLIIRLLVALDISISITHKDIQNVVM